MGGHGMDRMTDSELANLVADCLVLWGVAGRVVAAEGGIAVVADAPGRTTLCTVARAAAERRPARFLLRTAARAAAGRPAQAASSITGLLGGLREALGAEPAGMGLDVAEPIWAEPSRTGPQ
jgi:hypothetical protein